MSIKNIIIISIISTLMFSGCFWDWEYSKSDYQSQMQTIFTEVNKNTSILSNVVGQSSLQSQEEFITPEFSNALTALKDQQKKAEALASFRGSDAYKIALRDWISSQVQFFEKDIFTFLSAPETATSSEDMQNNVQKIYQSTKNIQALGKKVENALAELQ